MALGTCAAAHGATCNAGYYLSGGKCTICPTNKYCPGNDSVVDCPDAVGHARTTFPDNYYNPTIIRTYLISPEGAKNIESCRVIAYMTSERGNLYAYTHYNPETEQYDTPFDIFWGYGWDTVIAGYYLTMRAACGKNAYYHDVKECMAGYYCPGKDEVVCNTDNATIVHTETFGLYVCGDNTYSDAGAAECTPCPIGTGNSGDNAADHAGVESCVSLPLCTAGAKRLHAGNIFFNIWPNDKCSSPTLHIGLPGGVCCVNLAPGRGNRTININYNGQIYHTVN